MVNKYLLSCYDLLCYSSALIVKFYVNSLPIGIQCLLTGWIHLPKTDCLFLGFLKYAMNSWMKPEMLTSSSSRFSFTSKILHRILRSQQSKVEPLWMKVGGRSPRTASAASPPLSLFCATHPALCPHLTRTAGIIAKEVSPLRVWNYLTRRSLISFSLYLDYSLGLF